MASDLGRGGADGIGAADIGGGNENVLLYAFGAGRPEALGPGGGGRLGAPKPDVLGVSSLAGARATAGGGGGPPELDSGRGARGPEDGGGGRLVCGAPVPGV